jgi:hypothetical protein
MVASLLQWVWIALRKPNIYNPRNLQTNELEDEYFHGKRIHLQNSLLEYLRYDFD